jgi:hypothetical protein
LLCSEIQLVKPGVEFDEIKPLPCNRWSCERCGRKRRRALITLAASGEPNKILTLTVNAWVGLSPTHRRDMLHDAWKKLSKRILRQFALEPSRRWSLVGPARPAGKQRWLDMVTRKTAQRAYERLHYMAFLERTKLGEPHLHILLRSPFIPQDWLAEQMGDLIGAPVCWIEEIKNSRAAVSYVTKYVTKEPAQFGTGKRYWVSRWYPVTTPPVVEREHRDMTGVRIERERWSETSQRAISRHAAIDCLDDGWFRIWSPRSERAITRYSAYANTS